MCFKEWILKEDQKSLAKAYADLLRNVPQDPKHHPEGDALTHIKLVRKSIQRAVRALSSLKSSPPFSEILQNVEFNVNEDELQILYIAAWLHDIGKATATTIGGVDYSFLRQMDLSYQNDPSKIRAVGHDDVKHYGPLINSLGPIAPERTKSLYLKNKDTIDFIIDHHMSFRKGEGFSKAFVRQYFDNGKLINDQKVKLLLILMWADKMGRTPEAVQKAVKENESGLIDSAKKSIEQKSNEEKTSARRLATTDPASMAKILTSKGLPPSQVVSAIKGKFPDIDDEALAAILK